LGTRKGGTLLIFSQYQLNPLVHSGVIAQYWELNVFKFSVNTLGSGVKICILLGCETAGPNPGDKIGIPVDISKIPGGPPPMEMNNNNFGNNNSGGAQPMYGGMQADARTTTSAAGEW
jgi:hypothetical protein